MRDNEPMTPKEFAEQEVFGRRSARWVREQCAEFVSSKGRRGIPVVSALRPYLIPSTARGMFSRTLVFPPRAAA